jgi:transposase
MKGSKKIVRRRHSAELKAQVLSECVRPGASVAGVALSHGIKANVVHKWRRLAGAASVADAARTMPATVERLPSRSSASSSSAGPGAPRGTQPRTGWTSRSSFPT